jgi:nicotinamide-nucleotide amidase
MNNCIPELAEALIARQWLMATAESCTGGGIAKACTDWSGSSQWFEAGLVTYSNASKVQLLGVDAELIDTHGAVSEPVARAMAQGCAERTGAAITVATTGIAGPTGGSEAKPVGTVWLAWSIDGVVRTQHQVFSGNREQVRAATVAYALRHTLSLMTSMAPYTATTPPGVPR